MMLMAVEAVLPFSSAWFYTKVYPLLKHKDNKNG